nr:DUF916 domain-containing protein [Lacticaseibacillus absianus]
MTGWTAPTTVHGATNPGFSVTPELPAEQVDRQLNYWDLLLTPGTTKRLTLRLQNTTTRTQRFDLAVNRATTNVNGVIDYSVHGAKAPTSLPADLETLVSVPRTVRVAGYAVRRIHLTLNVPATAYDGVLLAGVRVTATAAADQATRTAYVVGLQVRTRPAATLAPRLSLSRATAAKVGSGSVVTAHLTNDQAAILEGLQVTARLTRTDSEAQVMRLTRDQLRLAPNSTLALPLNTSPQALPDGRYRLSVTAHTETKRWRFNKTFTVRAARHVTTGPHRVLKLSPWWFAGLVLIASGLAIAAGWLILHRHH